MKKKQDSSMHFVCTHDEAWQLVKDQKEFWVSNCGCREGRGECSRSRIDVCLDFNKKSSSGGSNTRALTLTGVKDIFQEAKEKHLVTRPFRDTETYEVVEGICFCCDDCCGYFLDPNEKCDKGKMIEKTNTDNCTDCGLCVEVCYFDARGMKDDVLEVNRESCYGCGLCIDECPEKCIDMVHRN